MITNPIIIVRGGGDMATAVIHRLWRAGFWVLVLETDKPSAIRRQVAVSEAVYDGKAVVEGMTVIRIDQPSQCEIIWNRGCVPLLVDPHAKSIERMKPSVVVDAMIAKRNLGTCRKMAPLTIALGPGFMAGSDVDAVIETMRGHNLGRIIYNGCAQPNTGIPGTIAGYAAERVIHAPHAGRIRHLRAIGDYVNQGEPIAMIADAQAEHPVLASISGLIRGLIREGYDVPRGFKIADIDPRREEYDNCFTISDKARCIAGSVLELVCAHMQKGR